MPPGSGLGPIRFPEAPEHLSDAERKLWDLFPRPVWIDQTDTLAVEATVCLYSTILDLRKQQQVQFSQNTAQLLGTMWTRLLTMLDCLGLTPTSRSKVAPARPDVKATDEPWAGII